MRGWLPFVLFSQSILLLTALSCPAVSGGIDLTFEAARRGDVEVQHAIETLFDAAKDGDAEARLGIGILYAKDGKFGEAAGWFTQSAEQGNATAQYILGTMYFHGNDIPQDSLRAYFWSSLSAMQGTGEDQDRSTALKKKAETLLSPEQRMQAEQMIREWEAKHPDK